MLSKVKISLQVAMALDTSENLTAAVIQ